MKDLFPFDVSLPLSVGIAAYPPGASFGPRRMRDWEFVWMLEGDAVYERDGVAFQAPENSLVLCIPGATDSFIWDTARRTRHAFFHFQMTALRPPATGHGSTPAPDVSAWPVVRRLQDGDILRPILRQILQWQSGADETTFRLAIAHLTAAFVSGETQIGDIAGSPRPPAVERAMAHIFRCLDEDAAASINLNDLAQAAFVSPEHLCRVFRDATGRSPLETVRLARLDRASMLLSHSNYSISEIAQLSGFANPFHFSRAFKNAFGQSPRATREAVRCGATPPLPRLLEDESNRHF